MFSICQRYTFEANHNDGKDRHLFQMMFSICQRYTFEANHNKTFKFYQDWKDVFNMPKIRFRNVVASFGAKVSTCEGKNKQKMEKKDGT